MIVSKKKYNRRYTKAPRGLFLVKDKFLRLRTVHASMCISPEATDIVESCDVIAKNAEILQRKHLAFANLINDAAKTGAALWDKEAIFAAANKFKSVRPEGLSDAEVDKLRQVLKEPTFKVLMTKLMSKEHVITTSVESRSLEPGMYNLLHGWLEDAKLQGFSKIDCITGGSNETH